MANDYDGDNEPTDTFALTTYPRGGGYHPADSGRYGAFELDDDRTVIYDVKHEEAWIETDATVDLPRMR